MRDFVLNLLKSNPVLPLCIFRPARGEGEAKKAGWACKPIKHRGCGWLSKLVTLIILRGEMVIRRNDILISLLNGALPRIWCWHPRAAISLSISPHAIASAHTHVSHLSGHLSCWWKPISRSEFFEMTCWLNWIALTPAGPAGAAWRCWLTGWNQEGRWVKQRYGPAVTPQQQSLSGGALVAWAESARSYASIFKNDWQTQNKSKQTHRRQRLLCWGFFYHVVLSTLCPPFKSGLEFHIWACTSLCPVVFNWIRSIRSTGTHNRKMTKMPQKSLKNGFSFATDRTLRIILSHLL